MIENKKYKIVIWNQECCFPNFTNINEKKHTRVLLTEKNMHMWHGPEELLEMVNELAVCQAENHLCNASKHE